MPSPELWAVGRLVAGRAAELARQAEDEGWDGIGLPDSQCLVPELYAQLGVAAAVTTRLGLSSAVTNPWTRHPAVAAAAVATLQAESGGRAVLGIGRGDSALAYLGLAPAPVGLLADHLVQVQGYLRGEDVPFAPAGDGPVRSVAGLGLADVPEASRLRWLPPELPKVPVDVAGSGPRVLALGARLAERVTLAVGLAPDRVRWAIDTVRRARAEATGPLPAGELGIGVHASVFVHRDRRLARERVAASAATFARYAVLHGTVAGPMGDSARAVLHRVHDGYDMTDHATPGSAQSRLLSDDVVDAFAIAGPPGHCVERLQELAELGVDRFHVLPPRAGPDPEEMEASRRLFVTSVLPQLR
ncbi:MAG: LLM class flavin-dependent oxidoreductase [Acidimicrobiia bacterium]